MKTSIMPTNRQAFVGNPMTAHIIDHRQDAINLDKVRVVIFVLSCQTKIPNMIYLKILSWNFDLVKLLELEITEPRTELFKIHLLWPLIQHFLEMISPFTKVSDIRLQRQLLTILREHKIGFEGGLQLDLSK
jgi:hypothetical protein